jgi:L-amino acid N-acyltransferase YncA
MEIIFRPALPEDLWYIVEIYNSVIPLGNVTADTEPITVASRVSWFYQHTSTRPLWIVEDANQKPVGWVSLQNFYGRPAYKFTVEISIYLSPSHRKKGYGRKILSDCIIKAAMLGIKTILAFIFSHNNISTKLFESSGFQCWGELPQVAILNGVEESLKIFGKRIDS